MFKKIIITLLFFISFSSISADINKLIAEGKWGNDFASYQVARAYDTGKGVDVDKNKAIDWYKKSAKQNNTTAQMALGLKYAIGKDIEKDMKMAYVWFKVAETNEHKVAESYRFKAEKELSQEELKMANQDYIKIVAKLLKK